MESRLRHGAAFCRRVALVTLLAGFAGSMAVAIIFERGGADGLSLPALLSLLLAGILGVLLFVSLFFMLARTMEGVAGVLAGPRPPGGEPVARGATPPARREPADPRGGAGTEEPGGAVGSAAPAPLPGREGGSPPGAGEPSGRRASLAGAVESIRLGQFVKVTTPDGWMGWVRDTDLPPADPARLPRTAAGVVYRPPGPSLSPGRVNGPGAEGEQAG